MHLSPALVSLPIFASALMAAPIPDSNGGNGGNAFSGAGGNASGGSSLSNSNCATDSGLDVIGLGLLTAGSNNGGDGGNASSGAATAGNGGDADNGSGFSSSALDLAHYTPAPAPAPAPAPDSGASSYQPSNPAPAPDNGNAYSYVPPADNGNDQAESIPTPKNHLAKHKGKPKIKPAVAAAQPDYPDYYAPQSSSVSYVAGNGGDAYSGAGGQATGANDNDGSASAASYDGSSDDSGSGSLINVEAVKNVGDINVLNNVLNNPLNNLLGNGGVANNGASSPSGSALGTSSYNPTDASSGSATGGDGGSINLIS